MSQQDYSNRPTWREIERLSQAELHRRYPDLEKGADTGQNGGGCCCGFCVITSTLIAVIILPILVMFPFNIWRF
jgi:hypothetical protein